MYGFNNPQGLVPIRADNNAPLASSLRAMPIQNGYATNIFTGDPVIWAGSYGGNAYGTNGYMISLADFLTGNSAALNTTDTVNENGGGAPILGVFQGVHYAAPNNSTSPNTPIRPYWPGGTSTADGKDPIGYFIPANYEYGFTVQATVTVNPAASMVGSYTRIAFNLTGVQVNGNVATGQSLCAVDLDYVSGVPVSWADANGTAPSTKPNTTYTTWLIEDIDYSQGTSGALVPYGNVIIRISNTAYPFFTDRAA